MKDKIIIRPYQPADHKNLMDFPDRALSEMGYEFVPNGKDSDIRDLDLAYLNNRGAFIPSPRSIIQLVPRQNEAKPT